MAKTKNPLIEIMASLLVEAFPRAQEKGVANPAALSSEIYDEALNHPEFETVISRPIGDFMRMQVTVLYDSRDKAEARAMADKLAETPDNGTVMLYRLSSGIWAVVGISDSNQAIGGA
jgi:hypothetical protein